MTTYSLFHDAPQYATATFPTPRPFQEEAHEALRQGARNGHRCQMLMAATGAGKTFLGLRAIHEALQKGKRAIFVCDRRTLIEQTSAVADSYGLTAHSVLMADHWRYDPSSPFQIASAQTLARRKWPDADLIVIDEAHVQMSVWVNKIKDCSAHVIGLSATPFSDGLGKLFSNLVCASSMHALTESGVLVPMRVFSCTKVNMRGAATSGGEWTDGAAAERGMEIIGDVVSEWKKFASDRKTIVFGATIAHCEEMARQFNSAGVMAACFTSDTSEVERAALLGEYRKPDSALRVLLSVSALAKGFDVQDVGCVCDVRPLRKSLSEAIQMWGRGLRSSPKTGKSDCIAEGSLVLTDRGLVPIQEILLCDKIWDGYEFVNHKGAIYRGRKKVITYAGITATPDHRVKTKEGWRAIGDCAREQTPIVTTGIGGNAVRACENYFTGCRSFGTEAPNAPSRASGLRDMWLPVIHSAFESYKRGVEWLQVLQQAATNSFMALCKMRKHGSPMQESQGCSVGSLRGARDRVSVLWSDCVRGMDSGKPWNSRGRERQGNRPDKQRRTLRAGKSSVGGSSFEYVKQNGKPVGAADAQIRTGTPGGEIRRVYIAIIDFCRNVIRGHREKIQPPVVQAEREVWDILDCGPRNSFTCEGLLVHNCLLLDFSGNVIRMADDFSDVFYNGLDALDAGEKLDKTIRRDNEEKPEGKACPVCGYQPMGKRCVSCGHEVIKPSLVEHEHGEMQEVRIGKTKYADDKRHLWEQACSYARGYSAPDKQQGRAKHIFRDISGEWPDSSWNIATTPSVPITRAVLNKIKSRNIAYAKSIGARAA